MAKSPIVPLSLPFEQITFDQGAVNAMLEGNGPVYVHYKAMPCPLGQIEAESIRGPHSDHPDCSNGFLYEKAGEFKASLTQNGTSLKLMEAGLADGSVAIVSIPQTYLDGTPVFVTEYDRLYIRDTVVLSTNTEKVQSHISGVDRLAFPASSVEFLRDAQGKRYTSSDYSIVNGNIVWNSDNRPAFDPEHGLGGVYSIRYLYQPFYYVSRLLHEIRLYATADLDGNVTYVRAPHQIMIAREKYFHKKQVEGQSDSLAAPSSGLFGPK